MLLSPRIIHSISGHPTTSSPRVDEDTDVKSDFFVIQRRRGSGRNSSMFASLLVGTFDSMFESKPPPYRILHTPEAAAYYEIAQAFTRDDILEDWYWLVANVFHVLREMESLFEVTNFTICKIQSLVAQKHAMRAAAAAAGGSGAGGGGRGDLMAAGSSAAMAESPGRETRRVQEMFNLAEEDRLVQYYNCK